LKWHGGVRRRDLGDPNTAAVISGGDNLTHHVGIVKGFGLPCVVAINRFGADTDEELAANRTNRTVPDFDQWSRISGVREKDLKNPA
ncbi:MAG: formate--tetrahydrofolate ligase, partial [Proteobacteria bacterium]|nr:formate--tetrahydrofolate ligase [Pseudomonadota bacterium]